MRIPRTEKEAQDWTQEDFELFKKKKKDLESILGGGGAAAPAAQIQEILEVIDTPERRGDLHDSKLS